MQLFRHILVGVLPICLMACFPALSGETDPDSLTGLTDSSSSESSPPTTGGQLCGDGVVDPGEMCDDGNKDQSDTCLNDCTPANCGDGKVHAGIEACDDGNLVDDDACTNLCDAPKCGDKIIQMGEQCDDGNMVDDDTCTNLCKAPKCGDKIIQMGEQCDDGNVDDTDACLMTCATATCGDGATRANIEDCDDGNKVDDDACTNMCNFPKCGDMIKQMSEDCDDGNKVDNDACTNICKAPKCGDMIQQMGEECDDGNQIDTGDACPNSCFLDRRVFVTSQAFCGNMSGYADGFCNGSPLEMDVMGVSRGDARCNSALVARQGFTFRAWLSDGSHSPKTRFVASAKGFGGRYVLLDGKTVADGWNDLVDGSVVSIKITEKNVEVPSLVVWTNTKTDGSSSPGGHCADWTSIMNVSAGYGKTDGMGMAWTDVSGLLADCVNPGRLYCFEDPTK